jgi:predicted nucleotidyltransferase
VTHANAIPADRIDGVYIEAHELEIVRDILEATSQTERFGLSGHVLRAFDSKRFSDLDLAVEGKLTLAECARLADECDESSRPFKVDIVELNGVKAEFRERIERVFCPIVITTRR